MHLFFAGPQPRLRRTGNKSVFFRQTQAQAPGSVSACSVHGRLQQGCKVCRAGGRASCCRISAHRLNLVFVGLHSRFGSFDPVKLVLKLKRKDKRTKSLESRMNPVFCFFSMSNNNNNSRSRRE